MLYSSHLIRSYQHVYVGNNNDAEYKNAARDGLPKNEVQIYTWSDATLQEIKDLLKGEMLTMLLQEFCCFLHNSSPF
jgi:hypothetical protein